MKKNLNKSINKICLYIFLLIVGFLFLVVFGGIQMARANDSGHYGNKVWDKESKSFEVDMVKKGHYKQVMKGKTENKVLIGELTKGNKQMIDEHNSNYLLYRRFNEDYKLIFSKDLYQEIANYFGLSKSKLKIKLQNKSLLELAKELGKDENKLRSLLKEKLVKNIEDLYIKGIISEKRKNNMINNVDRIVDILLKKKFNLKYRFGMRVGD